MLTYVLGLLVSFHALPWTSPIAVPSSLPIQFTKPAARKSQTPAPPPYNTTRDLDAPRDPFIVRVGNYEVRFLDFGRLTWHIHDIFDFCQEVHEDLIHLQQESGLDIDDSIPARVYRYESRRFQPPVSFSFSKDFYATSRALTFRDMYSVLHAMRVFVGQWLQRGFVPPFDIELFIADSTGIVYQGYGMLALLVAGPHATTAPQLGTS
ncbi:MAG: hypothetical protein Q9217_000570 [Psora testacea]